jgi:hypothetical protein
MNAKDFIKENTNLNNEEMLIKFAQKHLEKAIISIQWQYAKSISETMYIEALYPLTNIK